MLTYERMLKYEGAWHLERWNLFPECVVFECRGEEALTQALQILHRELPLAETGEKEIFSVGEDEERILREIFGSEKNLPMSKGVIRGGRVQITEGPLRGREQMIRKVDRHKRLAFLKMENAGNEICLKAGLEITEKTA